MQKIKSIFIVSTVLILTAVICSVFYFDKVIAFSVNHFTPYKIAYTKWKNPFGEESSIDDFRLELPDEGLFIDAKKAEIRANWKLLFFANTLKLDCKFQDATISFKGGEKGSVKTADEEFLNALTGKDQIYDRVNFFIFKNKEELDIKNFLATSGGVVVIGDCVYKNKKEDISLNVKISVSSDIYNSLPEDLRDKILSADEDNRYSTVIDYKGNITLLRALYSLM